MYFTEVDLRNFGPFRQFATPLSRGTVGVVGDNGRGKSTLVSALYGAVTNDFTSRFSGVKADRVNTAAGKKDKAYVAATLVHGADSLRIVRWLKGNRPEHELSINGGVIQTNSEKIEEELARLLGVDRRFLDQFVFKGQDQIYDFLSATDAVRSKMFRTLCHTESCAQIHDMLSRALVGDSSLRVEVVDDSDDIARLISQLEEEVASLQAARQAQAAALLGDAELAACRLVIRGFEHAELTRGQLARFEEALPALELKFAAAEERVAKCERLLRRARRRARRLRGPAIEAQAALRTWKQYRKQEAERAALLEEQAALAAEDRPAPQGDDATDIDALRREFNGLDDERVNALASLARLDVEGVVACPTCDTPIAALRPRIVQLRKTARTAPRTLASLCARLDEITAYRAARVLHDRWRVGYDARVRANQEALRRLPSSKAPGTSRAELRQAVADYHAAEDGVTRRGERLALASSRRATLKGHIDHTTKTINVSRLFIEEFAVDDQELAHARSREAAHLVALEAVAGIVGELRAREQDLARRRDELRTLRRRLKKLRRVRELVDVVSRVRDAAHWNALPNLVAQANLARMEGYINGRLELFGNPFWVEGAENLSLTVHPRGKPPHPAAWLSVGQRVVVATAFWLAVADMAGADVGLLALDEPTAHLDQTNQAFMAEAMGTITAAVRDRLQVFVVTHAEGMRPHFDQVVDLEETS